MKNLSVSKLVFAFATLLISQVLFSNTFEDNCKSTEKKYALNLFSDASYATSKKNDFSFKKNILAGPTITSQPQAQTKCLGGSVTFSVTATGTGNLTYSWKKNGTTIVDVLGNISGSSTSSLTITNVLSSDAANYTCVITDDTDPANPTTSNAAQLIVNPLPTLIKSGNTNVCIGQSTTISISGANSYLWNTGNTSSSISVNPITNTTYTVIGTDNNGCTKSESFAIQVNSLPTISISGTSTICDGTTTTLTATGALTYNWGSGLPNTSSINVNPTTNTTYTVAGTDSNGCINSASQLIVVNTIPSASVSAISPICSGNTATFTITGTPNATVIYKIGVGPNVNVTLNSSGLATVTVLGASSNQTLNLVSVSLLGCQSTSFSSPTATAAVNSVPSAPTTSTVNYCQSQTASPLTASGSNLKWYLTSLGGSAEASVPTPSTSAAGTFTYYVSQTINGCESSRAALAVVVNALPSITAGANQSICAGSTITLSGSGGTGTYSWNNSVINNVAFTPSVTTSYTVTGQGANGCTNTASVLVTVNSIPTAPILTPTHPNCTTSTGSIQFSGLPSTGNWTINPGSINGSGSTYTLNSLASGSYSYTVRDANLCTSAGTSVTINAVPTRPSTPLVGTITQPNCTVPTGSVVLSGLPTGTWTITKLPGGQTYTNSGASYTVTGLTSGTYTFSVSNGTCSSTASSSVVIDPVPTQSEPIVGLLVQPTCTVATGSVTLNGLPSTGSWTLTRFPDGVTLTSTGITKTITGINPGTYTYTVTNSTGCVSINSNFIVIDPQPSSPVAPIANAQTFLASANATISNLLIVSSGTPNWYANAVGGSPLSGSTLLTTGIYYASQTVNGCESILRTPVNVSVFPNSVGGTVLGTTTVCFGTNSTLLTLTGYTGSILKWQSSTVVDFSANVTDINIISATYTATNLTAPLYFRAVVQSGTAPVEYATPAFIDVISQSNGGVLNSSTAICVGQTSGLLALTGYNGSIIRWEESTNNGATWSAISNTNDTYTSGPLTATTLYRVVVQNGVCSAVNSSVVTITVKSNPVINDIPNQQVCFGDTKTFGEPFIAGYTYNWTSDTGYTSILPQVSITFNQVVIQNYTYSITNTVTGCSVQDQFQIVVNPLPNATVIADTSICAGDSINIGSNSNVGSTYSWSSIPAGFASTSSNPSVNPAITTTYVIEETVTASGCKKTNQVEITVQPIPVITIVGAPQFNICETTSQVQLNATITNPYSTFIWTKLIGSGSFDNNSILNPIYSPSFADIANGSVTLQLSVIGANPCTATYTQNVVINIDKKPIANAGLDVITCGTDPVQINATGTQYATNLVWSIPSGITGTLDQSNPYMPIYTPSVNDQNYVGPIIFTLTANTNTTCPNDTDTVSALITPAPKVDAGPPTATICEGSNYFVPFNPLAAENIVNSTILWTNGTGDGTIVGANSLTPTYIPGPNDIINGSVTLTLSAAGNNPCSTPATDNIIINIVKNPVVNVGPPTVVCEGPITLNSSIQNAGSILWTVQNGNGYFIDPTAIAPIYMPATTDLNTIVTFSVTVTPINNCGPSISDSVLYTINGKPSIVVGGNDTICQSNQTYQLQATATNTTSITWTSTGSGSFDNIHNEDPIYTLSPGDITAGSVTFTLSGTQTGCTNASDTMVLTIQKNPTADAGPAQVICQGDMVVLPGNATNASAYNWIRNGGAGTFINTNTTNPTYMSQPTESGTIYLTLIANAISPCTVSASSDTTITIIPKATADAGSDGQICEGDSFHVTTATASNNIGVQWSTSGDGTFTGGSTISPIYIPGPSDNNNGTVTLTLVATKNFPCNANAVDQMTLTINKIPVITVINPNVDLCVGDPSYIVTGVVPTNYDTLTWTSSGSGTFAPNNTVIAPTYFPSASDYTLGTVTLTLTASRNPLNCNSSTYNTITLHFISPPTVDAGPANATICESASYVTIGANAANYSNVTWSTTGTGTFTNATTLLATYTPSSADINLGFVDLTLMANPLTPCAAPVTDVIRLFLQKLPVITLTQTDAICVTQNSYGIGGTTVTDYAPNSYVWTTSGTGTFSPSGDPLNPIYNPSNADLAAGSVTLTLTVNSIAPCAIPVSSTLVLSFQKLPVANAGADLTRCALPFQIQTATADLTTVSNLVWSTSGTGTFDFTNIIDPNYTPSAADILSGSVRLTLTANPIAPCAVPLVTYFDVTLIKEPLITVVTPQPTICADETNVLVNGTVVQNAVSYNWTSTTGTTISNSSTLTPLVTPSLTDINNGYIDLTITAIPNAPCSVSATKIVRIPVQKKPILASGASQTICEGTVITTSDAISTNVTNLHWTNNGGDGTFTTSNLNTVTEYTPGPNEIANGQVLLTINGDAIAPCAGSVSSTTVYTIVKNPIVTISPTEVTICETETYTIPANYITIVNPTSILSHQWTTTTMASLTGASSWTPTYTPTTADIVAGFVNLTLTVLPVSPCSTPIIRTFKINIAKQATISFANDGFFCENINKQLSATFTDYDPASISWTIINGTGTLTGANTATPTYVPAADSGTVDIRISVASLAPCTNTVIQDFTITVVKKPIVTMTTTTDTVCSSQLTYNLTGNAAQYANSLLWTRVNPVGTGTFSDPTILNPLYTFNAADIANGFVTLRLTASSTANCNLSDYKEITINITKAPTVTTAPNDSVCQDAVYTATATATDATTVLWTTVGTSNGTFTNANQLVTQYTQGSNDTSSFTIQITANGNAPCAAVTATKVVQVQQKPILDAGLENRFNCSSLPYQITGVTGQNLGAVLWTSNSVIPGTFSDPTALNPIYTPSAAELNAGTPIILTVTAQAIAPCTGSVTDFIILNLTPNQVVDAGTYPAICEGAIVSLVGSATNASSVNWTSTGTGTFSAVNSLTTNYIPSAADIISGTVTLTLHAISNYNCPEVTDTTVITILKNPIANAGAAVSICEGSSYTLAAGEATAANYTAITWTATGPGALDATTINTLTPTYIPAAGQTGTVTLTLTATGYSACGINAVSDKTITIVPSPIVTVIPTKTICEGTTLIISATDASAINYASLQWSSSNGLGTFTPNNTAATIYTPATGQTGLVTLTLTASSTNGVCPTSTGNIVLDIIAKPIVEAGTNGTICQTGTYTVTGASVQNSTLYSWNVSGPATIQAGSETTLSPVIIPNVGASGTITVTLTAVGNGICPVSISDSLTIQINPAPVVSAGTSGYLCEGNGSFQLNGTGSNATTYSWTTTGGGIIQQTGNPLAPLYVPSASDYNTTNGVNVITINLNGTSTNGCSSASDSIQLTLYAKPKINAGLDIVACEDNTSALLNNATISNYNSGYTVSWSSTGNGTWDYSNSNGGINPVYIFGSNDTSSVTLTMSVLPNANCPQVAVTDSMTITIHQNPSIITSTNAITMCGETFTLPDLVTVSNNSSIQWADTTGGTLGTLTNATTETPIFTPSANEIANGVAQLTLTALPLSGCTVSATTTITVNLQPKATVNAGSNITACQGEVVTISNNASVQNYSTFAWTENGTGYIEPATINSLNPIYHPGTNEVGVITFTLQATNLAPCIGTVSQTMTLTISAQPTVSAGPDATICQNSTYTLSAATATNNTSVIWSSSPDPTGIIVSGYTPGTFNSATITNPIYTPSQDDINLGYVYLTIKALNSSSSCSSLVTDIIKITINSGPSVSAGSNATICEGSTYTLSGTSQANTTPSIIWTASDNISGNPTPGHVYGTFSNNNILNPVFTPSVDDINTGHVYLTLTGNASGTCPADKSTILLTIVKKPSVSTTDVQMCMDTPQVTLIGSAFNYQNLNWSIFSGPGSIINNSSNPLQPTFVSGVSGSPTGTTTVVRLFVTPLAGCPQSTSDYSDLTITIQPLPVVNAGQDGWLCYTQGTPIGLFTINGTSVTNNGVNITNTLGLQNWTSSSAFGIFTPGNPYTYQSNSNSCNTETLTLTVNGTGACANHPVTDSVTLNLTCASPNLGSIFPATSQICEGQTITYNVQNTFSTITNNAVQNYIWSVPTGATIVSGQGTNSIQVLFGSNSGAVSVTATNACGVSTVTLPTTVTSLPTAVATISGPQTVCAGSTGNVYTATTIPGATSYIWTLPNGTTVTTTTNSITISFGANDVSGSLTVMGSNSCGDGTVSAVYPIIINPQPSLSSTLTPPAICSATAFVYTPSSTIAGSTFAWTIAPPIGITVAGPTSGNGLINQILTNTTPNVITVVYQITTTSPLGCTNTESVSVVVNPAPSLTSNPTPGPICSGTAFNYTPTSASIGAITWIRNTTPGIVEAGTNGSGSINEVLTNSTNAPITITYLLTITATANGCTNATSISLNVIVNPAGQVNTPTSPVVCNGTTENIVLTTLSTGGTTTYTWTNTAQSIGLSNGSGVNLPSFVASNNSTAPITGTIVVTPTYTYAGLSCNGNSKTFTVTVNPSPQVNTVNDQVVCNLNPTTLVNFTTNNTGGTTTYHWVNNNPNIGLLLEGNGDILPFIALNTGTSVQVATITVTPTYTNAGVSCTGNPITFTITVNPKAQVIQPTPYVFCDGSAAVVNLSSINTGGTTSYQWTNSAPSIGLPNGSGSNIPTFVATNSGPVPVVATITVTPTFTNAGISCLGTPIVFTITVNPKAQVNSIASLVKCNQDTIATILFSTTNTSGITTYEWTNTIPSIGLPDHGLTNYIPTFTATNTGTVPLVATITVTPTYTNAGVSCTGNPVVFTITVNPKGQANQIAPQAFCNGLNTNSITLSTNNVGGFTNYTWTNSNSNIGLGLSGIDYIPAFLATNSGTNPAIGSINVIPTFTYAGLSCIGNPMSFPISINPTAQVNAISSSINCSGDSVAINLSTINSGGITTYSWTNSDPSIGLTNGSGTSIPPFTAVNNGPLPIVATIVVTPTYTYSGVSCTGPSKTFTITVNPSAQVVQPNPQVLCDGDATTAIIFNTLNVGGTTNYTWTNSNPSINLPINGTGNTIPSFIATNSGTAPIVSTITVNPTYTNNGITCNGTAKTFTITVNPKAQVNTVSSQVLCNGSATALVNFSTINSGGVTTYDWTNSVPSIGLQATGSGSIPTFTAVNSGTVPLVATITVTPKFTNAGITCTGTPMVFTITVNPTPQVNQPTQQVFCNGDVVTLNLTSTTAPAGTTYTWTNTNPSIGLIANGSGNNIPTFTAINIGSAPVVATITITPVYINSGVTCSGSPITFTVTVNPRPNASITGPINFVACQNGTQPVITFTGANGIAPYTFNYQIVGPNGTFVLSAQSIGNSASVSIPTSVFGNFTITLLSVQDSSSNSCSSSVNPALNTAFVQIQQTGTVVPLNAAVVSQTVCENNAIAPILFTIGGSSTNAFVTNLPAGLTQSFAANILTISGTPISPGVYNYVIQTTGSTNGCNTTYTSGTITVNANGNIAAITPVNQTVCANASIVPIMFNLGGGATGGVVTFTPQQPAGITWSISPSNTLIIQGASANAGVYNYTVQSFGICGQSTITGSITINGLATVALVSGNASPTVCMNSSFATPIQYSINPATATMILSGSLPTGVTFNATTGFISGTPTQSGTFPYTISSATGCGNSLSGTILVNPLQSITYVSGNTNQVGCQNSPIDNINLIASNGVTAVTVSPALPAGINMVLFNGVITISGTPTVTTSIAQNYIITTQGGCGAPATFSVTFDIRPAATITLNSGSGVATQSVCQSSAILPIVFTIGGGATGINPPNLPAGLTITSLGGGVYSIQGSPQVNGIYNFTITTTGCYSSLPISISNVNTSVGIVLISPAGTDNQTLCQTGLNSPIQPIVYNVIGATNIVATGLPSGVTAVFLNGQVTISGTPTQSGVFNYTITSQPCAIVKAGVIKISTPIFITNEVVTNVSCSSNIDGAISVTIVGGVSFNGQYAIHWSGPNGYQQNQTTITGLEAGQYTLTGTDAIGCPIPSVTYTVLPAPPINISLISSTNVSCNNVLGCANFNITGGSGIFTTFTLQYLDPANQTLQTIIPANNNYYNICNLHAGLYYLTVKDSHNCTSTPYLFTIYDYSSLSIDYITMDSTLCQDLPGKVRIKVNSLDTNLTFYYNNILVPFIDLGNGIYELSINNPTVPNGVIKVKNGQNCWISRMVSTGIITPNFTFTSSTFQNYGYFSVNGSVQFTNLVNMSSIPAEYDHIVWDFGDSTPFKVFYNPADLLPNANGENFQTVFHTYTTDGIYQITLTVYNQFGCSRKVTKTIIIGSGATMMLPTIFTPNNDGINDLFRPSLLGLKDVAMYIYDDWGNLVYEFASEVSLLTPDWGWNGIEKGKSEPMNNDYRYYIMATTINDVKIEKEGRFLLVK